MARTGSLERIELAPATAGVATRSLELADFTAPLRPQAIEKQRQYK